MMREINVTLVRQWPVLLTCLLSGAGCTSSASDSAGTGGVAAAAGQGGMTPSLSGGTAGITLGGGTAGMTTGGAAAAGAASGSAGMGGAAGSVGGSAGTPAAGSGGSENGGAGGAAGGGGSGGTSPEQTKLAAMVLDGFTLVKPCDDNVWGCCCNEDPKFENQHITKKFGGDPNVLYNVKLRIAGVAERYWYNGGTVDPVSKLFYTGGLPTVNGPPPGTTKRPSACKIQPPMTDGSPNNFALGFTVPPEVNPSDGCFNGFNIFAMTVSAQKKSYYLNYTEDFDGSDRQPHACYENDYTITIPIMGQAQLDFYVIDGDHHQVANTGTQMVKNVKTAQPYHGNFLEFAVVGVTTQ